MRIIDSHAHIFPFLGGLSGFGDVREHLDTIQWTVRQHVQPVLRRRDGSREEKQTLITLPMVGRSSLLDVDFHVGQYGVVEWESDGEAYYLQYMPPTLADMSAPPELLVALMDHAGVATIVLHNDSIYGKLNDYFSDAVARWPDRFIALANVDVAPDNRNQQIATLDRALDEQGHRGLFFKTDDFFMHDFSEDPFGPAYTPFWDHVASRDIPVYWQVTGFPAPTVENTLRVWEGFIQWLDRYPDVVVVLVGGLPWELASRDTLPASIRDAIHRHPIHLEIVYPIQRGGVFRYPFVECRDSAEFLYQEFGAEKLVWGSDVPNVERYCTYRQSHEYLDAYDFISQEDRELILGGNMERIFGIGGVATDAS
jgi:predicted TIM-barrel fold metal-dependent hydrolase